MRRRRRRRIRVMVVMMAVWTNGAYLALVHSIWGFPCASPL